MTPHRPPVERVRPPLVLVRIANPTPAELAEAVRANGLSLVRLDLR